MTDWCQITYQYPCNNMNFIVNFLGQLWMAEGTISDVCDGEIEYSLLFFILFVREY